MSAPAPRTLRSAPPTAAPPRVVGVDFSGAMLTHGLDKVKKGSLASRIQLVRGRRDEPAGRQRIGKCRDHCVRHS
jgi:hypothetical protein